jgi:cob(I)alamin adenosyltransferase
MAFEDYTTKKSVIVVYTGEGKGKTSAGIGLLARSLGTSKWSVAFIQFIKYWEVGEHKFIRAIEPIYKERIYFYKGGKGFYNAGDLSAKNVTKNQHLQAAQETYSKAYEAATSGKYNLVVCDEINNAVHDGLLKESDLVKLMKDKHEITNLCLTGRNFPEKLAKKADIVTNMSKIKHHYDDKFLANKGVDY